mmetsp:Transcript_65165/g.143932  ORF Transcript_65165/g.143932 Transcript_65165/m.143932 type:complete len:1175 (+) Transcript_65165:132-3656(+)
MDALSAISAISARTGNIVPVGPAASFLDSCSVELVPTGGKNSEKTFVHEEWGPVLFKTNGSVHFKTDMPAPMPRGRCRIPVKKWPDMTSSEQKVMTAMCAQHNQKLRLELGDDFWGPGLRELLNPPPPDPAKEKAEGEARLKERCKMEMARPPLSWPGVTMDMVMSGWQKVAPGMFYGLPFPFSEAGLEEFGPAWLTKAFHTAGTMSKTNKVTRIIFQKKKVELKAGNNAGKFFFEVRYAQKTADLHEKLFAKIPFQCLGDFKSDRIGASVYKQPMEFMELNTFRLLESSLPFEIPRYYFCDISPETSNYILITHQIAFAELNGRKATLRPYEIEGPYEKCKDYMLRSSEKEYYLCLMKELAKLAAAHKTGKLGTDAFLSRNFIWPPNSSDPGAWGVNPHGPSGEEPIQLRKKLDTAVRFFSDTAKTLFPPYVAEKPVQDRFVNLMLKMNAYRAEINYWRHIDPNYVAMGHGNLNVDNVWFWRKEDGELDVGVFDFGGFGSGPVGHRMWWCIYAEDFPCVKANLEDYIDVFIKTLQAHGGPRLDANRIRTQVILTAFETVFNMVNGVPNCLKAVSAKEFATIKDRFDPLIAGNVNGKSTHRTTCFVMNSGIRIIEEMGGDQILEDWIQNFYVARMGQPAKSDFMITGIFDSNDADPEKELARGEERIQERCRLEMNRDVIRWPGVSMDQVVANWEKVAPGMFYGLPFPFTEEGLEQFGPEWLTTAFHTAGTMERDNKVTKIIFPNRKVDLKAGNNAGKFFFKVEYAKKTADLHEKLFAKIPFPCSGVVKSDRIGASVYKQPMEFMELNTYRLLEAAMPMIIPRYYYSDMSPETSNYILITHQIEFAELDGPAEELKPGEIEGPYEKCKDYMLRSDEKEYYLLLMTKLARLSAAHKTGKLGSEEFISASFISPPSHLDMGSWGMNPFGTSSEDPVALQRKLDAAVRFFSDTAKSLFPPYVTEKAVQDRFVKMMMTLSAYRSEINFWRHSDPKYVSLGHGNLNVDNVWFWRDLDDDLECGVFDWGAFGTGPMAHRIWWCIYAEDFECVQQNLDDYIDLFIQEFKVCGGYDLDGDVLRKQIILTAFECVFNMVNGVPNCVKMVTAKGFAGVKDRFDPLISGTIDGKSTHRTTCFVMNSGIRIMQEMDGDKVLEEFIQDFIVQKMGWAPKTDAMIFGS